MATETTPPALYDASGRLTRAGMEAAVGSGGSFPYKGRIITTFEGIPSPEELADSATELAAVDGDLDAQIAVLQARKARVAAKAGTPQPSQPPVTPPAEPTFGDGKHPASYFAGMTDEEMDAVPGVGLPTIEKIKAALTARA